MNLKERKALTVAVVGRRLGEYMNNGPVPMKAAFFTLNSWNPNPLGITGLEKVPPAWFDDVEVPGFLVKRVGKTGILIT